MVAGKFNALEALRIAIEMERTGHDFYMRAYSLTKDDKVRDLMQRLAQQEISHKETFEEMYDACRAEEAPGEIYDEETNAFLSAVAADIIFPGGVMKAMLETDLASPQALLREGIRSEKDSCLFYTRVMGHIDDPARRQVLEDIIEEEEKHLVDLTDMLLQYGPEK